MINLLVIFFSIFNQVYLLGSESRYSQQYSHSFHSYSIAHDLDPNSLKSEILRSGLDSVPVLSETVISASANDFTRILVRECFLMDRPDLVIKFLAGKTRIYRYSLFRMGARGQDFVDFWLMELASFYVAKNDYEGLAKFLGIFADQSQMENTMTCETIPNMGLFVGFLERQYGKFLSLTKTLLLPSLCALINIIGSASDDMMMPASFYSYSDNFEKLAFQLTKHYFSTNPMIQLSKEPPSLISFSLLCLLNSMYMNYEIEKLESRIATRYIHKYLWHGFDIDHGTFAKVLVMAISNCRVDYLDYIEDLFGSDLILVSLRKGFDDAGSLLVDLKNAFYKGTCLDSYLWIRNRIKGSDWITQHLSVPDYDTLLLMKARDVSPTIGLSGRTILEIVSDYIKVGIVENMILNGLGRHSVWVILNANEYLRNDLGKMGLLEMSVIEEPEINDGTIGTIWSLRRGTNDEMDVDPSESEVFLYLWRLFLIAAEARDEQKLHSLCAILLESYEVEFLEELTVYLESDKSLDIEMLVDSVLSRYVPSFPAVQFVCQLIIVAMEEESIQAMENIIEWLDRLPLLRADFMETVMESVVSSSPIPAIEYHYVASYFVFYRWLLPQLNETGRSDVDRQIPNYFQMILPFISESSTMAWDMIKVLDSGYPNKKSLVLSSPIPLLASYLGSFEENRRTRLMFSELVLWPNDKFCDFIYAWDFERIFLLKTFSTVTGQADMQDYMQICMEAKMSDLRHLADNDDDSINYHLRVSELMVNVISKSVFRVHQNEQYYNDTVRIDYKDIRNLWNRMELWVNLISMGWIEKGLELRKYLPLELTFMIVCKDFNGGGALRFSDFVFLLNLYLEMGRKGDLITKSHSKSHSKSKSMIKLIIIEKALEHLSP